MELGLLRRKAVILQSFCCRRTQNSPAAFREADHLLLCGKITAVCYNVHYKHENTLCKQNADIIDVKAYGTYSYHGVLRGYYLVSEASTSVEKCCQISNSACRQLQCAVYRTYV
jgi:hypothetical protein